MARVMDRDALERHFMTTMDQRIVQHVRDVLPACIAAAAHVVITSHCPELHVVLCRDAPMTAAIHCTAQDVPERLRLRIDARYFGLSRRPLPSGEQIKYDNAASEWVCPPDDARKLCETEAAWILPRLDLPCACSCSCS
jgi:hypothetical protein